MSFETERGPLVFRKPPKIVASGGVPLPTNIGYDFNEVTMRPVTTLFKAMEERRKWYSSLTPEERHAEDLRCWAQDVVEKIEIDMDRCPHCGYNPREDKYY